VSSATTSMRRWRDGRCSIADLVGRRGRLRRCRNDRVGCAQRSKVVDERMLTEHRDAVCEDRLQLQSGFSVVAEHLQAQRALLSGDEVGKVVVPVCYVAPAYDRRDLSQRLSSIRPAPMRQFASSLRASITSGSLASRLASRCCTTSAISAIPSSCGLAGRGMRPTRGVPRAAEANQRDRAAIADQPLTPVRQEPDERRYPPSGRVGSGRVAALGRVLPGPSRHLSG
jgi:hypothetical protein